MILLGMIIRPSVYQLSVFLHFCHLFSIASLNYQNVKRLVPLMSTLEVISGKAACCSSARTINIISIIKLTTSHGQSLAAAQEREEKTVVSVGL